MMRPLASRCRISRGLGLLVLSASLSISALARASDPASAEPEPSSLAESLSGSAKRDYELGRLLYDNGDFSGALLRFESARRTSGDARLWWNAAVCEKALRHYAKAALLMRAFLAGNAEHMTEATRASARDFAAAAESLTAPLVVTSNMPGADLYLDSESLGQLPLAEPARVDWGAHRVLVKMAGYYEYTQTVTVAGSGVTRVAAVLRPIVHEGRIIVRASEHQMISLDGQRVAWGSWEGALESGRHSLRVSAEGFTTYERKIDVSDAQTQGFDVTLERGPRSPLPAWVWLVGGSVLAAGAATAGYFVFKPDPPRAPTPGSLATVQLQLR